MGEDDITFYDYYSEEGLIKRAIYFTDQLWTDGFGPDPAGWFDAHDISVMTGVELE